MFAEAYFRSEGRVEFHAGAIGISAAQWIALPAAEATPERAQSMLESHRLDFLPLEMPNGRIREYYRKTSTTAPERVLITHHDTLAVTTPVREVIRAFAETDRRMYFLLLEERIVGLVTVANLNSRPVNVYLFNLLSEVELRLAAFLRRNLPVPEVEDYLLDKAQNSDSPDARRRVGEVLARYREDCAAGLDNHVTEYLYFSDLLNLTKNQGLYRQLQYPSGKAFTQVKPLNALRNQVAHPTRSLVTAAEPARVLWSKLDLLEELLFRLRQST